MSMRRAGKKLVAITLAAAMMGSLTPEACTFLQNEVVYAAETSGALYENSEEKTVKDVDFSSLTAEDWDKKAEIKYADTSDVERNTKSNFDLKTRVKISADAYQTLEKDGNFIKLQGVVKLTDGWTYTNGDSWPYLDKNAFKEGADGNYYADATIEFKDKDAAQLMEIDFEIVGVGFKGDVTFSDVSIVNKTTVYESVLYSGNDVKKQDIDFSALTKEDWGKKETVKYADTSDTERVTTDNFKVKTKVTIDKDAYQTLEKDGSFIKLQGVVKLTDDWTYTNGDSWPYLDKNAFKEDADGNYYADATIEFKDKDAAKLMEIDFEIVGSGFKGTVSFSDVSVINITSEKPELTKQDPTVLSNLDDESQLAQWAGETGYQYYHGGEKNATPEISYDANDGDGRLKVGLNYTANSGETWSEAKVKFTPQTLADVSNYNQLSVDLIYPENTNISKMKFFSDGVINKDTSIDPSEATDAGNGYKKVTVTMGFSPSETPLADVTIGLIGVNSSFVGEVYLDNLTLSQKDESADYTEITETPDADGAQAAVATTAKTLTMTDAKASESAKALYAYLQGLTESDQVLFGHQNDVSRSVGTNDELGDVHDVTGSVSGIFGIDSLALFGSEAGGTDAESALENSINYSKKAAENGAIVTLSTHMPNFTNAKIKDNGDGTYDFYNCDFNEAKDLSGDSLKKILPGGEKNEVFTAYLDTIAIYANELQKENIPVIFRPFHENTGGWFWWGSANTAESYKSLYAYTREYLESKGVHNMLYVYSPNGPLESEDEYMTAYPGDAYVDILAFDYYNDFNTYPASPDTSFFDHLDKTCQVVSSVAKKHDKLAAISETGVRVMKKDGSDNEGLLVKNNPVSEAASGKNWYQEVSNIAKKNDMPYYLVWANFSDTNFYVPYKYNDTMGQEMINDFISYYNSKDSIFGNGTNFYNNIGSLSGAKTTDYTQTSGYMVTPFDMDTIVKETTLKASVSNASDVSFVVTDTATGKKITLKATKEATSGLYAADLTTAAMAELGKTDVASIALVADGKTLSTIENLSIGKEKEKAPKGVLENFDYYVGSNGLLDVAYGGNSAAGCSSSLTLDQDHKKDGTYGAAFTYKLSTTGSEVWTGRVNSSLSNTDFSDYNALKFWTKLDGKGQKVVVQIKAGGEEFEVYLTNLAKTEDAYEITVPFRSFKGKNGGKLTTDNLKDVQAFGIWCNSNPAGEAVDVDSVLYFDAFTGTTISEAEAAKADADGLIAVKEENNSGNNSGSNSGTTGDTTSSTTPAESTKSEQKFDQIAENTNATLTVTKNEKGEVTEASAAVEKTVKKASETKKTTISAAVVEKLVKTAGTDNVTITQTTKNTDGSVANTITVSAKELKAGSKLTLVKIDKKTGEKLLVNKKVYTVANDGSVTADTKEAGTYALISEAEAKTMSNAIVKQIAFKKNAVSVKKGKSKKATLAAGLNLENVAKITYTSSKKSVAKVDKNGKVTAKKAGKAIIKAKVTLKNGKTKTIKMTVTVTK